MAETGAASSQASADKSGGVIPELDELKLCIRTIKDENPEQGIAKVNFNWVLSMLKQKQMPPKRNLCQLTFSFWVS
jgi:hypothetical protein